jgi:hypothetical protein
VISVHLRGEEAGEVIVDPVADGGDLGDGTVRARSTIEAANVVGHVIEDRKVMPVHPITGPPGEKVSAIECK